MAEADEMPPTAAAVAGDEEAMPPSSPAVEEAVSKPAAIVVQTPEIVILPDTTSPDVRLPPRYTGFFHAAFANHEMPRHI